MERERLEARAQAAEARSEQLSSDIVALREKIGEMEIEFNKESISHLQERGALVERADVLEIQLKDANSSISALDESLKQAREEIEKRLSEVNMITESLSEVSAQLSETKGKCEILETKLMSKNKELFNAEEAARVAEEGRLAIKQVLTARSAEIDANEVKWRETAEQYEQKLEQMIQQYEKAISIVGDPSTNVTNETLTDPDTPNTMVESLQSVIRFLREEKQLAVTRSMNAEVEMKRLRAETNEIRVNRDEMVARLNRLEAESVAASDALAERTQLMERLESMASTQRQNMMLRMENEKLHKVSSELLKQKQDLETKQESLNTQLSDITMKITMLNGEVTTRRRENDLLKQRLEQIAKTHDVTLQADLEQCKSRLSRMEAELKTAGEQAVQAEQQKIAAEKFIKGFFG
uniref:Myosin_tail_1 domain-containing protein n=1 Tax=Heterorhabditis bacteriophora TaxID=37862 RepID=A0A1I7XDE1_HETBA